MSEIMPITSRVTAITAATNELADYADQQSERAARAEGEGTRLRQQLRTVEAERDSLRNQIETWEEVNAQTVERANRFLADLRDCRARLAALVEAYGFACGVCDDPACIAFRDAQRWLAAHPEAGNG